jgi:uncharacterized protein
MEVMDLRVPLEEGDSVSALVARPAGARALLVLGHGAGAGMRHPFMAGMAAALARHGVATFRYQFPYMEAGRRRPDPAPRAMATVRAAVAAARGLAPELPLFAGGKSFGGRMTSRAAAEAPLEAVLGLVFLGFPLHPAGRPGVERADHLRDLALPSLFVQGTRDRLADLDLLTPVISELGHGATLHVVDSADHSFNVPRRSGRTEAEVLDDVAGAVAGWVAERG